MTAAMTRVSALPPACEQRLVGHRSALGPDQAHLMDETTSGGAIGTRLARPYVYPEPWLLVCLSAAGLTVTRRDAVCRNVGARSRRQSPSSHRVRGHLMLETAIANLRFGSSLVLGRPFHRRSLERILEAVRATHEEMGGIGVGGDELLGGPTLDASTQQAMQGKRFRAQAARAARRHPTIGRCSVVSTWTLAPSRTPTSRRCPSRRKRRCGMMARRSFEPAPDPHTAVLQLERPVGPRRCGSPTTRTI